MLQVEKHCLHVMMWDVKFASVWNCMHAFWQEVFVWREQHVYGWFHLWCVCVCMCGLPDVGYLGRTRMGRKKLIEATFVCYTNGNL